MLLASIKRSKSECNSLELNSHSGTALASQVLQSPPLDPAYVLCSVLKLHRRCRNQADASSLTPWRDFFLFKKQHKTAFHSYAVVWKMTASAQFRAEQPWHEPGERCFVPRPRPLPGCTWSRKALSPAQPMVVALWKMNQVQRAKPCVVANAGHWATDTLPIFVPQFAFEEHGSTC